MSLTQRFAALVHTWNEERTALEVGRATASSRADDLARSYIHFPLDME